MAQWLRIVDAFAKGLGSVLSHVVHNHQNPSNTFFWLLWAPDIHPGKIVINISEYVKIII